MSSSRQLGFAVLIGAALSCSCVSVARKQARAHEKSVEAKQTNEGTLVRRREGAPGETFLIIQRGQTFTKWRVYDYVVTERQELNSETLENLEVVGAIDGEFCLHSIVIEDVGTRGTRSEVLGTVDTQLEICFAGSASGEPIDCDELSDDRDLAPYITWPAAP